MPTSHLDKPRRWLSLGVTFALAVVTALGFGEWWLRLSGSGDPREAWQTRGFHRADPDLIYALTPNTKNRMVGDEFVEISHTNALGLRDREVEGKPALRILVLGDSLTFGQGVGDDETYANQLEQRLRSAGRDVDVINAGIKGYGTDQSYRMFTQRLRFLDPDILVLAFSPTDLYDNYNLALYELEAGSLVPLDATRHPLYRQSRILERLPDFLRGWELPTALAKWLGGIGAFHPRELNTGDSVSQWLRRKTLLEISELVRIGQEDGFTLLAMGIPGRDEGWDQYRWLHEEQPRGARFLDLSRDRELVANKDQFYFQRDEHLSAAGHRLVAERLQSKLAKLGLL
ncbi:GDSL-type esterase/lipase family protein [Myxococcota bacterium]|nr:GDSL-type esterase/lipase family protein [Myxococcota bacterium]